MMYVTVSKPRCGCHEVPLGSPGAYSTSPIWSMWMNGSRSRRSTPAKARRTGKPSPSKPDGAVVTERTRRRTVPGAGTGTRGRVVVSSTVTAGMPASSVENSTSGDTSAARPRCLPSTADDFDPSTGMPRRRGRPSPAASGGTFLAGPEGGTATFLIVPSRGGPRMRAPDPRGGCGDLPEAVSEDALGGGHGNGPGRVPGGIGGRCAPVDRGRGPPGPRGLSHPARGRDLSGEPQLRQRSRLPVRAVDQAAAAGPDPGAPAL